MSRLLHALWVTMLVVALGSATAVDGMLPVPPLKSLVTDLTGTLSAEQKSGLEQRLRTFEDKKGSQVAVLIVPSTQPEAIEQYALRVVEQWKLGRKKVDDGVLLLVAKNDRALRIEVGYGLEGVLNDATAKRIISEIITPKFKQGNFFGGINDGVNGMLGLIEGEPLPVAKPRAGSEQVDFGRIAPVLLVIAVAAGGMLRAVLGRFPGALVTAGAVGFVAWFLSGALIIALVGGLVALIFTLLGGGTGMRGGMYGRGGGGFGGGFGGGGFGGGGGGFGGGGASGRW